MYLAIAWFGAVNFHRDGVGIAVALAIVEETVVSEGSTTCVRSVGRCRNHSNLVQRLADNFSMLSSVDVRPYRL